MAVRNKLKWIKVREKAQNEILVLLSPMDLFMPNMHVPMVLSFPSASQDAESSIEHGLRNALFQYQAFSGRLTVSEDGRSYIHLNNEGVAFVVATSDQDMLPFLDRQSNEVEDLLASFGNIENSSNIPLLIQLTRFKCGGLALGVERHHRLVDGTQSAQFLLDWALSTKMNAPVALRVPLSYDRSSLMSRDPPCPQFQHPEYQVFKNTEIPSNMVKTVKLHFSTHKLSELKAQCEDKYSTFVTLSAYLWKTVTTVRELEENTQTCYKFTVDGRRALGLDTEFFGNVVFDSIASSLVGSLLEMPLQHVAAMIYQSVKVASKKEHLVSAIDFLALEQANRSSQCQGNQASVTAQVRSTRLSMSPHIFITSWLRFPIYDLDFGFGNPSSLATAFMNKDGAMAMAPSAKKDGSVDVFMTLRNEHAAAIMQLH